MDPVAGGPVEAARQQARVLGERGHRVDTVSLDAPAQRLPSGPVPVDASPALACEPRTYQVGSGRAGYGYDRGLYDWLRSRVADYDLWVVHGLWQYPGLCVHGLAQRHGVPYVVFTHGMLDPWFKQRYPLKHLKKWLYWPWADYRVLRDARAVLFTATEEVRLARESFWLYRARERVVGLGTADRPLPVGSAQGAFLAQYPGLEGRRCLLYLSRIHPKKGCDLLIQAFSQVAAQDPQLHLVMAGPDPTGWIPALQAQARSVGVQNRVSFTGMLSGELKWGAFDHAEAFVLPSHQENFGIVVAEALASERPVLTTYKVNIWREIEEADAGFIAADDLLGIRQLLERWLALSLPEQMRMRGRARALFASQFEIEAIAGQLERAYEEACLPKVGPHTHVGSLWRGSRP